MDQLLPFVETAGHVLATQQEDQMGGVIYRDEGQLTRITAEYVRKYSTQITPGCRGSHFSFQHDDIQQEAQEKNITKRNMMHLLNIITLEGEKDLLGPL